MIKVTVIMPSLNVAAFIEESVRSVMKQTLYDIEILCVDAGSDDGTEQIIKKLSSEDPRVRLIHSDVKSYGFQMNLGIGQAQGQYIGIVETDDLVEPDMYENLYAAAKENDADIAEADFDMFVTDKTGRRWAVQYRLGKYNNFPYNTVYSCRDYFDCHLRPECHIWKAIYKKDFLLREGVRFNETPGASFQDFGFRYQTEFFAHRIIAINKIGYHYRRDNENASTYNARADEYNLRESEFVLALMKNKGITDRKIWGTLAREFAAYLVSSHTDMYIRGVSSEGAAAVLQNYRVMFRRFRESGYLEGFLEPALMMHIELLLKGAELFDAYVKVQAETNRVIVRHFLHDAAKKKNIIVFGSGIRGNALAVFLLTNGLEVRAFCDNDVNKQGQYINDIPVLSLRAAFEKYDDALFIISSPGHFEEMEEQLTEIGVKKENMLKYTLGSEPAFCTSRIGEEKDRLPDDRGELLLSTLPKTWIFDLDGTLVKHNGYKTDGGDSLLPGAKEYIDDLPEEDRVIILTSRTDEYKDMTVDFLKKNGIRYDEIIFNIPMGERIVINDRKPSGIDMAYSVNLDRDFFDAPEVERKL